MSKLSQKEIGAILYNHYMKNYCQSYFSFDEGRTRAEIIAVYEEITNSYSSEELDEIEDNIEVTYHEGMDYDYMEFRHPDYSNMFLQVTSLIDYNGDKPEGYTDDEEWADVGMFFVDYEDVDFTDLNENNEN